MPGARRAAASCAKIESTRDSHHGHTGFTRHSPRNGFTAYSALFPVIGLSCHRHQRSCLRQLDAGVEASEPHDFAVRITCCSSAAHQRPSHPVPNVRDDRETPLCVGRDGIAIFLFLPNGKAKNFSKQDWTGELPNSLSGKSRPMFEPRSSTPPPRCAASRVQYSHYTIPAAT
jgi:hypothetical protein